MRAYKTLGLVIVGSFCFLTSCRAKRQDVQKTESIETFKEVKEFYRDTTLYTPKAETSLTLPVAILNNNGSTKPRTFTQKNGNATAKITTHGDSVTITATCDSLALRAQIKRELIREATARSDVERTKTHSGYSLFNLILAFVCGVLVGAIITFIIKIFT